MRFTDMIERFQDWDADLTPEMLGCVGSALAQDPELEEAFIEQVHEARVEFAKQMEEDEAIIVTMKGSCREETDSGR